MLSAVTIFPTLPLALPRPTSPLLAEANAAVASLINLARLVEAASWAADMAGTTRDRAVFDRALSRTGADLGRACMRWDSLYQALWRDGEGEHAERLQEVKRVEIRAIDQRGAAHQ